MLEYSTTQAIHGANAISEALAIALLLVAMPIAKVLAMAIAKLEMASVSISAMDILTTKAMSILTTKATVSALRRIRALLEPQLEAKPRPMMKISARWKWFSLAPTKNYEILRRK